MLRERVRICRERRGRVGVASARVACMGPLGFHVPLTRFEDPRGLTTTLDGGPTHEVPNREEGDLVRDSVQGGVIKMRKGMSDRDESIQTHQGDGGQLCMVGRLDRGVRMGDWNQRVDDERVELGQDTRVRRPCSHSKSISNMDWDADIL